MTFIKIDFERGGGELNVYRDSITLTQEQFDKMTEQEIEDLKDQRYQNWLNFLAESNKEEPNIIKVPVEE